MKSRYREALDYVHGFTDYEKQSGFSYSPVRFDLKRVERLLALLGNAHHAFKAVHVAGTKGKGSTLAMIASILRKAGYRKPLYTSPHLHTFRERIQIDGELIPKEQVVAEVDCLRTIVLHLPDLTTLALIAALAFDCFAQQGSEWAVIEVGMGGRWDATNVIRPLVSVDVLVTQAHHPRAATPEPLVERIAAYRKQSRAIPVDQALTEALHLAHEDDLICATGSLFLVADFRVAWLRHTHEPPPPSDAE